jgi:hypothetical protein
MHCHLIIPQLFPAAAADEGAAGASPRSIAFPRLPTLERLLARARRSQHPAGTLEAWAAARFGLDPETLPIAPWRAAGDGFDSGEHTWVCLEPVHLAAGARDLRLQSLGQDPSVEELAALMGSLQQALGDETVQFLASATGRCYARATSADLHSAPPPGPGPVDPAGLPAGPDGPRWRRLLTEAQMVLHDHPVNQTREQRGLPAINALWAWGAGRSQALASHTSEQWSTDDALLQGLARAAGAALTPALADPGSLIDRPPAGQTSHPVCFVHLPQAEQALRTCPAANTVSADDAFTLWRETLVQIESLWIAPLLSALDSGRIGMITVHALSGVESLQAEIIRADLRRFWRRPRALSHWINPPSPGRAR